ncbi:hypothetical protein WJX81_002581 [Elliptochloris bilobata]|uniref:Lon N-terminal domain-containing protein n=1 Tax=Elliptochloris bilobata TaxID=381761 RepID=A0AAW1SKK0_9CHLO
MPLHIFEARYRVLFNTLLAGAEGLEEGLIQYDKPFCGSRQFGMCWMNSDGGLAAIGTLLRIERHSRMPDGRLAVDNLGVQRFRVLRVLEQAPVLMCEVEMLQDEDDSSEEVQALAAEVAGAFRDLLQLNHRMGRIQASKDSLVLGELESMRPRDLSFWIGSVFADNSRHQQSLLQEDSTLERLKQEHHVLVGTVSYLRAKLALEGAFSGDSDSSSGSGTGSGSEIV